MTSPAISTIVKMIELLPQPAQDRVVKRLREYIEDLRDELDWDAQFGRTQAQLIAAARRTKDQIANGQSEPLQIDQL